MEFQRVSHTSGFELAKVMQMALVYMKYGYVLIYIYIYSLLGLLVECANINAVVIIMKPSRTPLRVPGVASRTAVPTFAAHDLAAAKGTLNGLACAAKFYRIPLCSNPCPLEEHMYLIERLEMNFSILLLL